MSLCAVCTQIPWRTPRGMTIDEKTYIQAFARLESVAADRFQWADGSGRPVKPGRDYWPYIRNSDDACRFCQLVTSVVKEPDVQPTYHGGFRLKKKEFYGDAWKNKGVWTQLLGMRDERPIVRVWVGDERPEHFVRSIEAQTTFDSAIAKEWPHVVQRDPLHPTVRKQMLAWLTQCNNEHRTCSKHNREAALLPTRVLDLGALPSSSDIESCGDGVHELFRDRKIRLLETESGQRGEYVALSYCWGKALPCKTTTSSYGEHAQSVDMGILPNTIRDSIIVTRLLGVCYIWIDCLCIIQDDKDDWERESARMANIYSQSYLSIAATRASNCDEGILSPRTRPTTTLIPFQDDQGKYELYFEQRPRGLGTAEAFIHNQEPLQRRAWVFQERILSPRTLHFSSDQLYWECASVPYGLISEDGWGNFDPRDSSFEHSLAHVAEELVAGTYRKLSATKWGTLVNSYTALDITYPSDRLPALAGIISTLQDMTGDVCYAGLWRRHFLNGLLWYADQSRRLDMYRAPSWSFASIEGHVSYFVDLRWADEETRHIARLEECSVTPLRNNSLGELKAGYARITGPVTQVEASPEFQYARLTEYWNCTVRMGDGKLREAMARFDFEQAESASVLMITGNVGLLIWQVSSTRDEWERIGIVEIRVEDDQETDFEGFEPTLTAADYPPARTMTLV